MKKPSGKAIDLFYVAEYQNVFDKVRDAKKRPQQ